MALTPEAVGRTLSELRKSRGLTQRDIATQTGFTVNYLSLLENGQRVASMDAVNKIASALAIPAEFILFLAADGRADGKHGPYAKILAATKDAINALIAAESAAPK